MSRTEQVMVRLQASADGLLWALEQLPTGRLFVRPLPDFGEWSALQILAHVMWYERSLALPHLRLDPLPQFDEDALNESHTTVLRSAMTGDLETLVSDFERIHTEKMQLLESYTDTDWTRMIVSPMWGEISAFWVAAKSYQHRLEHTDTILKMTLFWDMYLSK